MATSDTAAAIAAVAAKIKNVGQARAALGVVADVCQKAYVVANGIRAITDEGNTGLVIDAARSRIDTVNNYAVKVYNTLADDDASQGQPVPTLVAAKVALVLGQANRAFHDVEEASSETQWSFAELLEAGIANAAGWVGEGVEAVVVTTAKSALGATLAFTRAAWPTMLLALLVVGVYVEIKTGFFRSLLKGRK